MKHLFNELREQYLRNNLNFDTALKVWGEVNLSPNQIKQAIKQDCGLDITTLQSEELQRYSCEYQKPEYSVETPKKEFVSEKKKELLKKMKKSRLIRLTPTVRACVEKIGNGHFRSKFGSVEWMIKMIDGQPHLARIEKAEEQKQASESSTKKFGLITESVEPSVPTDNIGLLEETHPGLITSEQTPMMDILSGKAGKTEEDIIDYLVSTYGMDIEEAEELYYEYEASIPNQ